jgi:hypothetical protein
MNYEKYDAFEKELSEKYPAMFAEPYGGIGVGEGWWPIIASLCASIQGHIDWKKGECPQVTVAQIKEKFGGLRFYYDGGDEQVRGMVRMAENWASNTCEDCGSPATHQTSGWIKTVCEKHFNERETSKKERVS